MWRPKWLEFQNEKKDGRDIIIIEETEEETALLLWRKTWACRLQGHRRTCLGDAWTSSRVPRTQRKSPTSTEKEPVTYKERRQIRTQLNTHDTEHRNRRTSSWTIRKKACDSGVLQSACMPLTSQGKSKTFADMQGFRWCICRKYSWKLSSHSNQSRQKPQDSGM